MIDLFEIYELLKTKSLDEKIPYSHKIKTKGRVKNMSIGRVWFNLLTPETYKLINEPVNEDKINEIIEDIYNKYSPEISSEFITRLNYEAFRLGTLFPSSFDISSLIVPDFILEKKKELLLSKEELHPEEVNNISKQLAIEYLDYIKNEYDSGIYDIIMSGAKGSPQDWAMLMIAKGALLDIEGNISKPVLNSLDDGFDVEEFYSSAAESRYLQFYKSKGAADPGYLNTQMAFAFSGIFLSGDDCNSTRYFNLLVTPSISKKILGRFYLNEKTNKLSLIKDLKTSKSLINKTIKLRSPLYCKQKDGICKTCYGKLGDALSTNKIGLLTAATINDLGVNKAMKVRHEASQINIKKANFLKDIII